MSVSIVTLANLGKKTNFKTAGILPVIEIFAEKNKLRQVICQVQVGFSVQDVVSAVPAVVRYAVRLAEVLLRVSLKRLRRLLVSSFVRWRLKAADIVFFHPATRFGSAMRKAKRQGSIVVGIATVAHPRFDEEIHREECQRYNIPFEERVFKKLDDAVESLDYLIAYSDFVAHTYKINGFPEDKIFVAYSDPDRSFLETPPKKKQHQMFTVLYLAQTDMRKGLHYLLEAWSGIGLPDAELVIVGGFDQIPEAVRKHYTEIINNDPSITYVGYTKKPEQYYQNASLFVFPSLSEGNAKAVMEAMSYRLPVVTTEHAQGLIEDGKSGFVVPVRDVCALQEKIQYCYEHTDETVRIGETARKTLIHKEPFGDAVFSIYQEIVKRERI